MKKEIIGMLETGMSKEDVITIMYHKYKEQEELNTKSKVRALVESVMEESGLVITKVTKADQIKEWLLAQPDPLKVTKDQIKAQCLELEMKGGSIQYYVMGLTTAQDLARQLTSK